MTKYQSDRRFKYEYYSACSRHVEDAIILHRENPEIVIKYPCEKCWWCDFLKEKAERKNKGE